MKKVVVWVLKAIGGLFGALLALIVVLMLAIWVADPTVLRNVV